MAGASGIRRTIAGLIAAATVVLPAAAQAADGDLDPSFGGTGVVEHNYNTGGGGEAADEVMLDASGRLVAVGTAFGQGTASARFRSDGTPDPAWDGDGYAYFNPIPSRDRSNDAVLLGADRVAVAGFIDSTDFDAFGAVLNSSGTLDPTWGNDAPGPVGDGLVRLGLNAADSDQFLGVDVDSQGRVVLAGRTGSNMQGGLNDILVARYGPNGERDTSFGTGGFKLVNPALDDRAFDVLAVADDKILALATTDSQYVLIRLNTDGTPDPNFGSGGFLPIPGFTSPDAERAALARVPDGSILIEATVGSFPNWKTGIVRLRSDGTLDPSFGEEGATVIDTGQRSTPGGIAVGDDGRALVGINVRQGTENHGTIRRLGSSGTPDSSFGSGGSATLPGEDVVNGLAVGPDRRILFAGSRSTAADPGGIFLVGRMLGDTVAPETAIKGKKRVRAKKRAKFELTTINDVNASFECALKKPKRRKAHHAKPATFSPCSSPLKTKKLRKTGKYKLLVRATDPAGNVEPTPASKKFKVKRKRR
jgi:uncharacterized delta-60 repeat protein